MFTQFKHFIVFICIPFLFLSCSKINNKDKVINIIFRYDDASATTSSSIETKILSLFSKHNLPLTFAIIPYRCTGKTTDINNTEVFTYPQNKANLLKKYIENGTLEVALHGYSHQTISTTEWTEFKNVPYEEQLEKLTKGKKLLESFFGENIYSFVPPYNTYDLNTLKALKTLNIHTISADMQGIHPKNSPLTFLSYTTTLDTLASEIKKTLSYNIKESFIVVMFHQYNLSTLKLPTINKSEITFLELDTLLSNLKKQPNINILSFSKAQEKLQNN